MRPDSDGSGTAPTLSPRLQDLGTKLRTDFESFINLDDEKIRSPLRRRLDILSHPGFWAVVIFRLSSLTHRIGLSPIARLLAILNVILFSCDISPRTEIGPGLAMPHPQGVAIGAGVVLGRRVKLLRGVAIGTAGYKDKTRDGFPIIGDDCTICDGAKVFGPVIVGARTTLGTSVVLFDSVPSDSVVVADLPYVVRSVVDEKATGSGAPVSSVPSPAHDNCDGAGPADTS